MVGVEFIRACMSNSEDINDLVDYLLDREDLSLDEAKEEAERRVQWIKQRDILEQAEEYESYVAFKEDLTDRIFPEDWKSPLPEWVKKQVSREFFQWL